MIKGGLLVNKLIRLLIVLVSMTLVACSSIATKQDTRTADKMLMAHGYSRVKNQAHLTAVQNQFAIEQAAKINAYRKLAKQLYSESLENGLLVADQVIKEEPFRIYLDLFLRQARVVDSQVIADQKMVGMALTLTPRFYACFSTTVARVAQCLKEDDKVQFTRIGYQTAAMSTVNLSCPECSLALSVSGYSAEKNGLDRGLLNVGLYDSEWIGNMATSTLIRYWYLTHFIFN